MQNTDFQFKELGGCNSVNLKNMGTFSCLKDKSQTVCRILNWSRSMRSGTSCATHGHCSSSQRKLNTVLQMQCFVHKPLLRKECSCGHPIDSTIYQTMLTQRDNGKRLCKCFIYWKTSWFVLFIFMTKSGWRKIVYLTTSVSHSNFTSLPQTIMWKI